MKKLWTAAAILVATAIVIVWQWQPLLQRSLVLLQPAALSDQVLPAAPLELPAVSSDRLFADLQTLTFRRYNAADRQRARDYIQQELTAAGWLPQLQPFENGVNIYAEQAGSDPKAGKILLGAHYDTVEAAPGADDNATAVATLLEAARQLANQPIRRTLQLVFFDLEEQGLLGSQAFLKMVPANQVQGAVILDMVGYSCDEPGCQTYPPLLPIQPPTDRGNFLAALGDQGHAELLESFIQPTQIEAPPILTLTIPTFGGLAPDLVRSDHAPFWDKGIGAVLITDTANFRNPHYHQASDTLETINPGFFVGSAQIVINAVARLLQT